MEKLISLAQVEQLIDEMIEEAKREYTREEVAILEVARDKLSSLPTEESGWIAYKEYCIGPYKDGDVIEVLLCVDEDDGYKYGPATEYWYVTGTYLLSMGKFDGNTTEDVIGLHEPKNNSEKTVFGELGRRGEFDSTYVVSHRKIDVSPHAGYKPITIMREPMEWQCPT